MSATTAVLQKIAAIVVIILAGWAARRGGLLTSEATRSTSRFVVDVALPALVFSQLLRTVTPAALAAEAYVPLLGAAVLLLGQLTGSALAAAFAGPRERPTFVFVVAVANWIYLPLAIAQALYGDDGVRFVLLFNVGAVAFLWTVGVGTLRRGSPARERAKALLLNPGLAATAAGILLAVFVPAARTLEAEGGATSPLRLAAAALVQGTAAIGSLTIPLTMVLTGAQLGELDLRAHGLDRPLAGALLGRLVLTPLVALATAWAVERAGFPLPARPRVLATIIAAMPAAVSCGLFTERYGGDTSLASRAIFYGTLASAATVPAVLLLSRRLAEG